MTTSSNIGYILPDGMIKRIYSHSDGHPDYTGTMLQFFYHSDERVHNLVETGNLIHLNERIAPLEENHSHSSPEDGVCVFYGRDQGKIDDVPEIVTEAEFHNQEWSYLWLGTRWEVSGPNVDREHLTKILNISGRYYELTYFFIPENRVCIYQFPSLILAQWEVDRMAKTPWLYQDVNLDETAKFRQKLEIISE